MSNEGTWTMDENPTAKPATMTDEAFIEASTTTPYEAQLLRQVLSLRAEIGRITDGLANVLDTLGAMSDASEGAGVIAREKAADPANSAILQGVYRTMAAENMAAAYAYCAAQSVLAAAM